MNCSEISPEISLLVNRIETSMHSSRMLTARMLTESNSIPAGCVSREVSVSGEFVSQHAMG